MRNTPAGYKHSDSTHLDFGKSADSSLLAKKRQGFANGGEVSRNDLAAYAGMPLPGASTESLAAYKVTPPDITTGVNVQPRRIDMQKGLPSDRVSAIHKRLYDPEV